MLITQITENFYKLENVFDDGLLADLVSIFKQDRSTWTVQPDGKSKTPRLEYRPEISPAEFAKFNKLTERIHQGLLPAVEKAEATLGQLYQNIPQLWYDGDGYINTIHAGDVSPNHHVNMQIYLCNGNENMSTYCYDKISPDSSTKAWHTVPYKFNCGYILFHPTKIPHGMKHRVVGERMSLYQGWRSTVEPNTSW